MISYPALHTEITTDPAAVGYAGKNRGQIAGLLNTPGNLLSPAQSWTKSVPQIPVSQVLIWAGGNGALDAISQASTGNASAQIRAICLAALHMFGSVGEFDVSDPNNLNMLGALVTANVITQAEQNSLVALQNVPATRAENLFGPGTVISLDDVYRVM